MCILLVGGCLLGAVKLTWDTNPIGESVSGYYIYEKVYTNRIFLGFSTTNSFIITNVWAGFHCYAITATNFYGESLSSETVCIQTMGNIPGIGVISIQEIDRPVPINFEGTYTNFLLQSSSSLTNWNDLLVVGETNVTFYIKPDGEQQFFRIIQ